jgi:Protein of unknown function DUF58
LTDTAADMAQAPSAKPVRELHYRADAPVLGHFPGHHRSRRGDTGFEFRGHARLMDAPDPRRLDLHASLRNPFGDWVVRVYSQRKSIPVVVVADLSASMGFEGRQDKLGVLADLVESLAWSAWRTGDSFGFLGCDEVVRPEWLLPATRARGVGTPLAERLRHWQPKGRSAQGLLAAPRWLGRQRALVFLASDFLLPEPLLRQALAGLATHDVVPVVLWDPAEAAPTASRGLAQVVDPESGRQQLIWWRPALRERWQRERTERRTALLQFFRSRRLKPLFIEGGFDADAVTRHFMA